jgi:hypothetical protein
LINLLRQRNVQQIGILLIVSILMIVLFYSYAIRMGYTGFPLDDAWIHQVYARNLANYGEWAFNHGQPSGGSTSPLWSVLLSVGYVLRIQPVIWSAILGGLALWGIGCMANELCESWREESLSRLPIFGLFLVLEWHLVWSAVSGMETALFLYLILRAFWLLRKKTRRYWAAGMIAGVATWVRPEGITILGPALFILLIETDTNRNRIKYIAELLTAFLVLFLPYLFFNLTFAGDIWPSTFSAKQAEYLSGVSQPFLTRLGNLFLPFLAGGGVVILPGFIAAIWIAYKKQNHEVLAMMLWISGTILLYALRLPVNYQHGRYMMPAMGIYFTVGLWGMSQVLMILKESRFTWVIKRFWAASLTVVTLIFLWLGCVTYQKDVTIVETEMVQTAAWLAQNTPANSLMGAHDIGAMGYFANRQILDLAGLVNPEVIPIIRDEDGLRKYLDSRNVNFLVTFPGWYPKLVLGKQMIYSTGGTVSPQEGGENMAVYSWK